MGATASTVLSISLLVSLGHEVSSVSQSAFLTPTILTRNGATITVLADDTSCTPDNADDDDCWSLEANTPGNHGFHLQLSLDDSWAFESTANTTLKIEIRFNCNTLLNKGSDMVMAFTSTDSTQYFANLLAVGRTTNDYDDMYPLCSTPPAYSRYTTGNVVNLVDNYSKDQTRWEKIAGDQTIDNNAINQCNTTTSDTLMLTLENHPKSHMTYSYEKPGSDPVDCAFATSTGISNIYFGSLVSIR